MKTIYLGTDCLRTETFKSAIWEVLYRFSRDKNASHSIDRIVELVESSLIEASKKEIDK